MKKHSIFAAMALVLALVLLSFAACAGPDEDVGQAAEPGVVAGADAGADAAVPATGRDTLNVVVAALPISMDPHMQLDMYSSMLGVQMFDTLFVLDPEDMTVQPRLAATWDRPDMETLNITLRDDVYFHNGDRLTANDVRFSVERAMASPFVGFIVGMVDGVVVHDDLNLTITTSEPFAPLMNHLSHFGTAIMSERAYNEFGSAEIHNNPIGTGAFRFESIALGDRVVLRRFDDYWGQMPAFSTIEWRAMPEATNRLIEVEAGHADIALEINPIDIARAEASPSIVMHRRMGIGVHYLGLNLLKEPFDDIRVRHAIAHALDLETISSIVYEGAGAPGIGPISASVWGSHPVPLFEHNVERARELMAEAGLADGFETTLWFNTEDAQYELAVQIMQSQLREIGIEATIQSFEWATYLELTEMGEQEMFLLSWYTLTGDADYGLYDTSSTWGWGGGNRAFSGTPEIDELLRRGRQIGDAAERLEIYREVQYLIRDHAAKIYFQQTEELHITTPQVRGFVVHPTGLHRMYGVTFVD